MINSAFYPFNTDTNTRFAYPREMKGSMDHSTWLLFIHSNGNQPNVEQLPW